MEFLWICMIGGAIFMAIFTPENWIQLALGLLGVGGSIGGVVLGYQFGQQKLSQEHTALSGEHGKLTEKLSGEHTALSGKQDTLSERHTGEYKDLTKDHIALSKEHMNLQNMLQDVKNSAEALKIDSATAKGTREASMGRELEVQRISDSLLGVRDELLILRKANLELRQENMELREIDAQLQITLKELQREDQRLAKAYNEPGAELQQAGQEDEEEEEEEWER